MFMFTIDQMSNCMRKKFTFSDEPTNNPRSPNSAAPLISMEHLNIL